MTPLGCWGAVQLGGGGGGVGGEKKVSRFTVNQTCPDVEEAGEEVYEYCQPSMGITGE
ncbi:hypothetical protein ZHAS_00005421 [Anopheles sinensis]|uniref:Uncharacterized protein n=1 Tax=Anopheles sinensis TaxID=74873 RepID=A0A084VJJ2_ANOSI|nr:hypothetical protein ZHAS_00005421 [Anopheles sinensis]